MAGLEMNQNDLFAMTLGLSTPWKVVRSGFEVAHSDRKFLYVDLEVEPEAKCLVRSAESSVHCMIMR